MSGEGEYCCYIGGLAFSTSERGLKEAFEKFGRLVDAKVVIDKLNGRSRGFGFVTFDERKAMEEAIEAMNGMDLDGRNIIVEKAQTSASGRDQDGGRDRGRDRRDYGGTVEGMTGMVEGKTSTGEGMTGMEEKMGAVLAVIEMGIARVGVVGISETVEVLEMTAIIETVRGPTSDGVLVPETIAETFRSWLKPLMDGALCPFNIFMCKVS
ncbi:hypothetical protein MLD38_022890 [Melastoma candidum]|uniref:Uncharacterized protein n=1 Tax=Melastoma candidum TaxID=119954 RepID=A0ACB9QLY9_9MYRT|nr:hypothetical protein MLD38_022890 [Melastoma candidum]